MVRAVPNELFEFMAPYPPYVLELMLEARQRVLGVAPDCTEFLCDTPYTVVFGYTYTHSYVQGFAHIPVFAKHIDLGFPYGSGLDDPEGRLIGTGSRVRHVKIRTLEDLDDSYLHALVVDAELKAIRPKTPLEATQIVKVLNGARRRPG